MDANEIISSLRLPRLPGTLVKVMDENSGQVYEVCNVELEATGDKLDVVWIYVREAD